MWLKLVGCTLVVIACAGLGFSLAARCSERPRQISQLIAALAAFAAYVNYATLPLAEALTRAASGMNGPVGTFLRQVATSLADRGLLTPREALEEALAAGGRRLAWERAEREVILQLGSNLGTTGRDEQQKYLAMVLDQLRRLEQEALHLRDRNAKMYRYLGICGGLAVAIILI